MAKFLVIEDYPSVRELLSEELAPEGYVILSIGKPESISDLIKNFDPDLIIMDPFMGGKMRWDFLRKIKTQKQHLPILIFTAIYQGDPHQFQAEDGSLRVSSLMILNKKSLTSWENHL